MSRQYDVIIWGASGFTGRLVAEYYTSRYGVDGDLKWAIAGRNQAKLEGIRSDLGNEAIPIIIADSMDEASLDKMVAQTKVICSTVGPYAKYGSPLVAACVKNGTDYCDLCGETQWIRRMIDAHHDTAKANGTRIVNSCGFDSIPSDMGVYFLQKEAKERTGNYCQHIKMRVKGMKGGFSGGTYASMNNIMAEAQKDRSIYKILFNPYSLNPVDAQKGKDKQDLMKVVFDEDFKSWISPFVMAGINTRIVRRSHALDGFPYGADFQYDEAMFSGAGIGNKLKAQAAAVGMGVVMMSKPNSITKKVVNRFMPKPGEGPSREERESGYFKLAFLGKFENGSQLYGVVKGDRDPGYGSTSKMLGESAVCLAKDKEKTPAIGGILTPATALGDALLDRLQQNAGLSFEIRD